MQTNDFKRAYEAFAAKHTAGVPGRLMTDAASSPGRSSSERHRELADELEHWCAANLAEPLRRRSRRRMPRPGARARRGAASSSCASPTASTRPDVRSLAIARETLARYHRASPISPSPCRASARARSRCSGRSSRSATGCRRSRRGEAIAAFAMTEPECGSDAANIATSAMRDGNEWVLVGEKTLHLQRRHRRFLRDLRAHRRGRRRARPLRLHRPGRRRSTIAERIEVIAPHPLARLTLRQCPHPCRRDHRRAGRRLPHRHGDAEPVPRDGRRGGARASRGARSTRR